jgi:hypothetical protein
MGGPEAGATPRDPLPVALRKEVRRLEELVRCSIILKFEVPRMPFESCGFFYQYEL